MVLGMSLRSSIEPRDAAETMTNSSRNAACFVCDRLGRERGVEFAGEHGGRENLRVAGAQLDLHLGIASVVLGEQARKPSRGGALHSAKPQLTAWARIEDRRSRFLGKRQQPVRVDNQPLAGGRNLQPLAFADKEPHAQILFKLPDASGHVGLHAKQLFRRLGDTALAHHHAKDAKVGQIHPSLPENKMILIIHFI
ncbi:hypothetical protein NKH02_15850 [Mesorhizobium sp. M1396]